MENEPKESVNQSGSEQTGTLTIEMIVSNPELTLQELKKLRKENANYRQSEKSKESEIEALRTNLNITKERYEQDYERIQKEYKEIQTKTIELENTRKI